MFKKRELWLAEGTEDGDDGSGCEMMRLELELELDPGLVLLWL